jgi:hypothetical protein
MGNRVCLGTWSSEEGWKLKTSEVEKISKSIHVANWQTELNQQNRF